MRPIVRRLALIAFTVTALPVSAPAAVSETCARPVDVPMVGRACPAPGGWTVLHADGTTSFTHGHDPVPGHLGSTIPPVPPVQPHCVSASTTEEMGVVVYAHPADRPDAYDAKVADVRAQVAYANGFLRAEAATFGRTLDYRMLCENGVVVVHKVTLSTTGMPTYDSVITDLRAAGHSLPRVKYWVWVDTAARGGGVGGLFTDDSLGPTNSTLRQASGAMYGITFGHSLAQGGAWIMMHENGHNIGAVQQSAPESSGSGHCNDGLDVMCYNDKGPTSNYRTTACTAVRWDCGRNDYFNMAPAPGSYLADAWNTGYPLNAWLQGCARHRGTVPSGGTVLPVNGVNAVTVPLSGCDGARFALWSPAPPVSILYARVGDVDVCFLTTTGDQCFAQVGWDHGIVPAGTTAARITAKTNVTTEFMLNIF